DATIEFYRETTKTVVTVDHDSLARIRQEAYSTQESLIVEEQKEATYLSQIPEHSDTDPSNMGIYDTGQSDVVAYDTMATSETDLWVNLGQALSDKELQALSIILKNDNNIYENIKEYADHNNIMLEVLADGINEKAMDYIGDNILDDEFIIYEDYEEQVKGMVKQI
ncbi:MAG: tellurite resistance TerB C-terminal domain-containing protein, partial [Herbinix sp.]|nr:tellurite resistance TerB C-terminal domain-containing protein [Herbinix sp.]